MNRDCSIESLSYRTTDGGTVIRLSDLQDWMTDKKIIKKGLNYHPYADVLHELAENEKLEIQIQSNGAWVKPTALYECNLRIKPSEPVYEYMYYDRDGKIDWLTDDEFVIMMASEPFECYRAEETKRIRV